MQELFKEYAQKLQAHYDLHGLKPDYPEDEIIEAIDQLYTAAHKVETFDWDQHREDLKHRDHDNE